MEVLGTRKNWRARRRHARRDNPRLSPSRGPFLSAHYFQAPAMQASNFNTAFLKTDSNYVVTQSAAIHIEDLAPLLVSPDVADRFFKYKGSLTTPGCYESVTWFVMNNHPQISELEVRVTRQQSE